MAQNNKAADDISDETDQTMDYACLLLYYIVYILCLIISPTINASIILTAKLCMYFIIRLFWQICKCQQRPSSARCVIYNLLGTCTVTNNISMTIILDTVKQHNNTI